MEKSRKPVRREKFLGPWSNLTEQERDAAKRVGYTERSWSEDGNEQLTHRAWNLLKTDEQDNLRVLGVTPTWWDGAWNRPWKDLTKKEQNAVLHLHMTKEKWDNTRNTSRSFLVKAWSRMKPEQQAALKVFKFDEDHWTDYISGKASENDPLLRKEPKMRKPYEHGDRVLDCPTHADRDSKQHFINLAYGTVIVLLVLAFLVSFPIMRNPSGSLEWFSLHMWFVIIIIVIWVMQLMCYAAVLGALKIWGEKVMLDGYIQVLGHEWWKCLIWACVFVSSSAVLIASVLAAFDFANICIVYLYTAFNILGLHFYIWAFGRKATFKTMYPYLVPIFGAVLMGLVTKWFMTDPRGISLDRFIALCISVGFGWMVVFDTQIIFGCKHEKGRKYPYYQDQWCLAGYEMYFDFYFFCLQSLKLLPGPATTGHV